MLKRQLFMIHDLHPVGKARAQEGKYNVNGSQRALATGGGGVVDGRLVKVPLLITVPRTTRDGRPKTGRLRNT